MDNIEAVARFRKDYEEAKTAERDARAKAARVASAMQEWCEHPHAHIVECPYESDIMGLNHHQPPWRLCILCGLAEEGWGSGYKKLAPGVYDRFAEISRDKLFRMRIP